MPALPANEVLVEVLNGSGQTGEATRIGNELGQAGFEINGTGNASSFGYTTSVVQYAPGHASAAAAVARVVEGPVELQENGEVSGNEVNLIVGSTCSGVRS